MNDKSQPRLSLDTLEEFNFQRLLEPLWYYRRLLLILLLVTLVLASIHVFRMPPYYRAVTRIMVTVDPTTKAVRYTEVKRDREIFSMSGETQIEIIKSPQCLVQAAKDVGLDEEWKTQDDGRIHGRTRGMVDALHIKGTPLIDISVIAPSAKIAQDLAQAVVKSYKNVYLQAEFGVARSLYNLFPNVTNIQDLAKLSYEEIRSIDHERVIETVPSIAGDPLVENLKGQILEEEIQLAELLKTYKEKHPRVLQARASIQHLEEQLHARVLTVVEGIRASLENQLKFSSIRVISEAALPTFPAGPNRPVEIAKILLFEIVLSCVLVSLFKYFRQTVDSDNDLERLPGLVHLGYVPKIETKTLDKRYLVNLVQRDPRSKFAEMVRNIRVSIDFSIDRQEEKSLLITSALPEEGKSIFSTNLALAYAQDGQKVLLVDADLRKPSIAKSLNLRHDSEFIHFLTGQRKFDDVILETGAENLSVVLTKTIAPNPVEILNSKRMSEFIRLAEEKFDKVLFDSPPLTGLSDSLVLSNKAKVTFLVVRARKTPISSLRKVIQDLHHASAKLKGAIINQIDGDTERYYYGNYRYSYSKYLKKR